MTHKKNLKLGVLPYMKIAWITDPHFDFIAPMAVVKFGEWVKKTTKADACIITGDIADANTLADLLPFFCAGFGSKTYFCLGNHDFYHGSFAKGKAIARELSRQVPNLVWLDEAGIVELTPDFALVGNGGWYDMRAGLGANSKLEMSDYFVIDDLKNLTRQDRALKCQAVAKDMAALAKPVLIEAAAKYKNVFFATHVPPFREATWHRGKVSDSTWLPGFSNLTFGTMLSDAAYDYPNTLFTVLCGHTHSEGVFTFKENMTVLTGHSEYSNPRVSRVFDLSAEGRNWPGAEPQEVLEPVAGVKEIPDRDG
jgi:Icc protein